MENNRLQEILSRVDSMTLEEIEAVEKEIHQEVEDMKSFKKDEVEKAAVEAKKQKTENKQKSIESKPNDSTTSSQFTNITSFRYGAMNLYAELGIRHDRTYSKDQLIELLNKFGYFEFNSKNTEFSQHQKDGTVVITIKGNSKGFVTPKIIVQDLEQIEQTFKNVYQNNKTEARALIYFNQDNRDYLVIYPEQKNTIGSTTSDLEFNIKVGEKDYYLVVDLHSHHKMGAFFSPQDDESEKFRNIVYGVFSWYGNINKWLFRYFDGKKFINLQKWELLK